MRKTVATATLAILIMDHYAVAAEGCAQLLRLEEPGYTAADISSQVGSNANQWASVTDNQGNMYFLVSENMQIGPYTADKAVVRKLNEAGIYSRFITLDPDRPDQDRGSFYNIEFDAINGLMYLHIYKSSRCESTVRVSGFAPLVEVLPVGPTGPSGSQGPPGPTGAQGPAGPLIPACPDADGDGWADCNAIADCYPYGHPCGDCDDHDVEVNPGQSERAPVRHRRDHKDNDCDGTVDNWRR